MGKQPIAVICFDQPSPQAGPAGISDNIVAAPVRWPASAWDCPRYTGGRYAVIEAQAAAGATIRKEYGLRGYCAPR